MKHVTKDINIILNIQMILAVKEFERERERGDIDLKFYFEIV